VAVTRTDAEWLRRLADLVEAGEIEVGRVEPKNCGVLLGTFQPGTFAKREMKTLAVAVESARRPRIK
jgi:hypothetical protein